jgi:hypothetical protein
MRPQLFVISVVLVLATAHGAIARPTERTLSAQMLLQRIVALNAPADLDPAIAYADCQLAGIIAQRLSRGIPQGNTNLLQLFRRAAIGEENWIPLPNVADACTPPPNTGCYVGVLQAPNAAARVHAGAIRLSLQHLVPLLMETASTWASPPTATEVHRSVCTARARYERAHSDLAILEEALDDASVRSTLGTSVKREHVEALAKRISVAARLRNTAIETAEDIPKAADVLKKVDVRPWAQTYADLQALQRLRERAEDTVRNLNNAPPAVQPTPPRSEVESTIFEGPGHCILGRFQKQTASTHPALQLIVRLAIVPSAPAGCPAGHAYRDLPLGVTFVNIERRLDGSLVELRGPGMTRLESVDDATALVRTLLPTNLLLVEGVRVTSSGSLMAGNVVVQLSFRLSLPGTGFSVPGALAFGGHRKGANAPDPRQVARDVVTALRDQIKQTGAAWSPRPGSPHLPGGTNAQSFVRLDRLRASGDWDRGEIAFETDLVIGDLGRWPITLSYTRVGDAVRLRLTDGALPRGAVEALRARAEEFLSDRLKSAGPNPATLEALKRAMMLSDVRLENARLIGKVTFPPLDGTQFVPDLLLAVGETGVSLTPTGTTWDKITDGAVKYAASLATQALQKSTLEALRRFQSENRSIRVAGLQFTMRVDTEQPPTLSLLAKIGSRQFRLGNLGVLSFEGPEPRLNFKHVSFWISEGSTERRLDQSGLPTLIGEALRLTPADFGRLGGLRVTDVSYGRDSVSLAIQLDDIPVLGTLPLGRISISQDGANVASSFEAKVQEAARAAAARTLQNFFHDAVDGLGLEKLEPVGVPLRGGSLKFTARTQFEVASQSLPIVVTIDVLPRPQISVTGPRAEEAAVSLLLKQGLKQLVTVLGLEPKRVEVLTSPLRLEVDAVASFRLPGFTADAVTFNLPRITISKGGGVRLGFPISVPLMTPILIPPIAVTSPNLLFGEDPFKQFGMTGELTFASTGVEKLVAIKSVMQVDLGGPLSLSFNGTTILFSALEVFRSDGKFKEKEGLFFNAETVGPIANILNAKGSGHAISTEIRVNGQINALGLHVLGGDILITPSGRVEVGGSASVLGVRAQGRMTSEPFPEHIVFTGTLALSVGGISLSDVSLFVGEGDARLDFTVNVGVSKVRLSVSGRRVADITPARILEQILALFEMKPEELLRALRDPSLDIGSPIGPSGKGGSKSGDNGASASGTQPGKDGQGGTGPAGSKAPAPKSTHTGLRQGQPTGAGSSYRETLLPGPVTYSFKTFGPNNACVQEFMNYGPGAPPRRVHVMLDAARAKLAEGIWLTDVRPTNTQPSTTDDRDPYPYWKPHHHPDGRLIPSGPFAIVSEGSQFSLVRIHLGAPCGQEPAGLPHHLPLTTLDLKVFTGGFDLQQARRPAGPKSLRSGDFALLRAFARHAVRGQPNALSELQLVSLGGEPFNDVYVWREASDSPAQQGASPSWVARLLSRNGLLSWEVAGPSALASKILKRDSGDKLWRSLAAAAVRGARVLKLWYRDERAALLFTAESNGSRMVCAFGAVDCRPVELKDMNGWRFSSVSGFGASTIEASNQLAASLHDALLQPVLPTRVRLGEIRHLGIEAAIVEQPSSDGWKLTVIERVPAKASPTRLSTWAVDGNALKRTLQDDASKCQRSAVILDSDTARDAFLNEVPFKPSSLSACLSPWAVLKLFHGK